MRAAGELIKRAPAAALLNERISTSYDGISAATAKMSGITVVGEGGTSNGDGFFVTPRLHQIDASALQNYEVEECFGPTAIIARYAPDSIHDAIRALPASLTGTIHAEDDEIELAGCIAASLQPKAGRLLFNDYPTGVLVSWAQQHGGPWPSTNTLHTSVGTTAIRRWLRPVTWQSAPEQLLPEELRDAYSSIPRRVDGELQLAQ